MTETTMPVDTLSVTINGKTFDARKGQLVIDAADERGVYIPRFCYHHRMRPVGMCRMCIVDIDTGRGPTLQPACMIPVADGMKVDTESARRRRRRRTACSSSCSSTIRSTARCATRAASARCRTRPTPTARARAASSRRSATSRSRSRSATSSTSTASAASCATAAPASPTRWPATRSISFIDRGNETQVNTFPDHPVRVVLQRQHRADLPGRGAHRPALPLPGPAVGPRAGRVDVHVVLGRLPDRGAVEPQPGRCATSASTSTRSTGAGSATRAASASRPANHDDRLDRPLVRSGEAAGRRRRGRRRCAPRPTSSAPRSAQAGPGGIAVLGGARLTNEAAYAWTKLAKGVLGTDNVDAQLGDGLPAEFVLGLPRATIDEACAAGGTVLLLGPDLKEELPVLYLRAAGRGREPGRATRRAGRDRHRAVALRRAFGCGCRPGRGRRRRARGVSHDGDAARAAKRPLDASSSVARRWPSEPTPSSRRSRRAGRGPAGRPVPARPAPGQRASAPSTWAWPRGCCPDGCRSTTAGRGSAADWRHRSPRAAGSTPRASSRAAADGRHRAARAARRRPADRLPRPRAWRPGPGRGPGHHRRRHLPQRVVRARRRRAGRRRLSARRRARTTNIEGRVEPARPARSPRRARPAPTGSSPPSSPSGSAPTSGSSRSTTSSAEIERLAPSHEGLTPELLAEPWAADGVVVPLRSARTWPGPTARRCRSRGPSSRPAHRPDHGDAGPRRRHGR